MKKIIKLSEEETILMLKTLLDSSTYEFENFSLHLSGAFNKRKLAIFQWLLIPERLSSFIRNKRQENR